MDIKWRPFCRFWIGPTVMRPIYLSKVVKSSHFALLTGYLVCICLYLCRGFVFIIADGMSCRCCLTVTIHGVVT
jgi:hypothetical protein